MAKLGDARPIEPDATAIADGASDHVDVFALLSHEIRTPLNGVLGMAGLLDATPLDATQAAYLQTLRECGEHLLGLVNDVLDLAKLQSGRVELEPAPTDLEKLLQGVCELLSPRAHVQGLEIGWAVDANAPVLLADDGRLRQILFNLIGNAVKMTPIGGVLALAEVRDRPASASARARVRFSVEDTGPGVDPADAARIFQPFVQARDGERAGGAGLGLAVVRRLAEAFGGAVGVETAESGGARFWFEADFDVLQPADPARAMVRAAVGVRTASDILRRAARRQLEACGAHDAAPGEPVDVVLQDGGPVLSPVPPGAPPTLVMLAPEDRGAIADLRGKGYAGYLIKPLRRTSLAERVRAAMDAGRTRRAKATMLPALVDERASGPASGLGLHVLLAEDNAVNALLASALLTRRGCQVVRVGSGDEAVRALADVRFDLVLMDMRMPGMSGLEATRALRAAGCRTPVVALTANAFEDDRRACLEAGMDDFLSKPLDPAALDALFARLSLAAESPVTK